MIHLFGCAPIIVGGTSVATATSAQNRRTVGTQVEDQAIEFKASSLIRDDEEINDQSHINITSYNTIVLLTGEVPTEEIKNKVSELVRTVPKVSHIYNETTIAAPSSILSRTSDSYITSKLKSKMLFNENLSSLQIKVVTENGVVYLMGIVSREEAEITTQIAKETNGVQKIVRLFQYSE